MEPLVTHAAEAADMLGVGRSGVFRLIAAMQLETIKIGRSRHISVASIRHVAGQSAAEALAVLWRHVDLDLGVLRVTSTLIRVTGQGLLRKRTKSQAGERILQLPSGA